MIAHRQRGSIALVMTSALLLVASPVFAGAPTDRLRHLFFQVDAVLSDPATEDRPLERVARIRRRVSEAADIRAAAAVALGQEWEARTA